MNGLRMMIRRLPMVDAEGHLRDMLCPCLFRPRTRITLDTRLVM